MKLTINHGRIMRIEDSSLNPVLPTSDLAYVEDKDLFKEIRNYIKSEHNKLENKLIFKDGVMKHSNAPLAVAVDMFFKKYYPEYRISTQRDLEANLPMFKGFYIDTGLALRNLTGANKEQAEYLFEQLKKRGVKIEDFPLWINLRGLELDKNLNFNLTDEAVYSTQPSLNWKNGTHYSITNELGLPKEEDTSSSRSIWTDLNYALSRCYLGRDSDLGACGSVLASSYDGGRVVLKKVGGNK